MHGRDRHCVWCLIVCREYMADRHCVWYSMVGSIKWDNVQNESHGRIKKKKMINTCIRYSNILG